MKRRGGDRVLLNSVSALMPVRALELFARFRSAWAVGSSWALNAGERGRALIPATVAAPRALARGAIATNPGVSSSKSLPVLARNGRAAGSELIAASSAGGGGGVDSRVHGLGDRAEGP